MNFETAVTVLVLASQRKCVRQDLRAAVKLV